MRALSLFLAAGIAACQCGGTSPLKTCQTNAECGATEVCEANKCVTPTSLVIITDTLPDGTVGTAYSAKLEARGGATPYTFSLAAGAGLPSGLSLASDGTISGTPGQAGTASFDVAATDAAGKNATRTLSLSIKPATGEPLAITSAMLPDADVGVAYTANLTATGGSGTLTWSLASGLLPAGLTLSAAGVLSGTPAAPGSSSFTVQVVDSGAPMQLATANLSLTVKPASGSPLQITTTTLPDAALNTAYSAALAATGGTAPYDWSLAGGSTLPSGLTLDGTGMITGTPTQSGTSTFTVQVADASSPMQVATALFTISVGAGALTITTATLPGGTVGTAYSAQLMTNGGTAPVTFSLSNGALPQGLQLSAAGALSGTPTSGGTFAFTVQATDASTPAQVATRSYSIAVQTAGGTPLAIITTTLADGTVGTAYTGMLSASGGTAPYSWSLDVGSTLPPGLSLGSGGALSGTPTVAGQFSFTVVVGDSSAPAQTATAGLTLTIAATSGTLAIATTNLPNAVVGAAYSQTLAATGGLAPYTWSVASGTLPPGLMLSAAGVLSGTPTTAGTFNFTLQVTDAGALPQVSQATFTLTVNANPSVAVTIITGTLPVATVGRAYSFQLAAAGGTGPYAWSVAGGTLPNGITLSAGGILSGTPAAAGNAAFTVEVTDSSAAPQIASRQLAMTVLANPGSSLVIVTSTLPPAMVGSAYNLGIVAAGGVAPYAFAIASGSLPAGLTLGADGHLTGTPTVSGGFTFTVRVTDATAPTALTADRTLVLNVSPGAGQLFIVTSALPPGRVNMAYSAMLQAASGTAPYTWTLASGVLPAGLMLSASGTISGSPTALGSETFTVQVSDASMPAKTASRALSITVR